ncbi:MAG: hypothetical protein GY856_08200 [bacterium]|nr:hypothetical protein [bacterium]
MRAMKLGTAVLGAAVLMACCAILTTAWADPPDSEEPSGEPAATHRPVVTLAGAEPPQTDAWRRAIPEIELQGRFSRPRRMPIATCPAQGERGSERPDPCLVGAEISRMPPCLDAEDCPAYELWIELYGPPRVETAPHANAPIPAVASDSENP